MLIRRIGLLLVGLRWVPLGFSIVAPFPLVAFGVRPLALGIILLGSVNLCPWVRPPNLILEWLGVLDGSLILTDSVVGHLSRCQNAIQKIPDGVRLIELAASGRAAGAARWQMRAVYQAASAQETTSHMWCLSLHNHGPHRYTLHCDMNEYRRIISDIFMLHISLKHIMHTHTHLPRYTFHVVEYTSFDGSHIHVQDFGELPMLFNLFNFVARRRAWRRRARVVSTKASCGTLGR